MRSGNGMNRQNRRRACLRVIGLHVALLLAAGLAGCQAAPPRPEREPVPPVTAPVPPTPPSTTEAPPAAAGERCYRLIESELRIIVYKAGPLARVGHNHVLVSRSLSGAVSTRQQDDREVLERARVVLPVESLDVDPPEARVVEGPDFERPLPPDARSGTRANLLGERVLDAANHPQLTVTVDQARGPLWAPDLALNAEFRGGSYPMEIHPGVVAVDGEVIAVGSGRITHAQLGLEPFSALGGGLRVAEHIDLRYRLRFSLAGEPERDACVVLLEE